MAQRSGPDTVTNDTSVERAIVTLGIPVSTSGISSDLTPCHSARIQWTFESNLTRSLLDLSLNITIIVLPAQPLFTDPPSSLSPTTQSTTSNGISPTTATSIASGNSSESHQSTFKTSPARDTSSHSATSPPDDASPTTITGSSTHGAFPRTTLSKGHSGASATAIAGANGGGHAGATAIATAGNGYIKRLVHHSSSSPHRTHPIFPRDHDSSPGFVVLGEVPVIQRSFVWLDVDVQPGQYTLAGRVLPTENLEIIVKNSLPFSVTAPTQDCSSGPETLQPDPRESSHYLRRLFLIISDASQKTSILAVAICVPLVCIAIACISFAAVFWLRRRRDQITPFYARSDMGSESSRSTATSTEKRRALEHFVTKGSSGINVDDDSTAALRDAVQRAEVSTSTMLAALSRMHATQLSQSGSRISDLPPPMYPHTIARADTQTSRD